MSIARQAATVEWLVNGTGYGQKHHPQRDALTTVDNQPIVTMPIYPDDVRLSE